MNAITLRALEPEDIDLLYTWENDQRIWEMSNTIAPFSKHTLRVFIDQSAHSDIFASHQLRLMIDAADNHSTTTIGMIDLFDYDPVHQRAGVGIFIDETYRRQGIAKKAIEALIDFVKKNIPMHQLYCSISAGNTDSIHLFSAAGFIACGEKKQWLKLHNKWTDELMFQKILEN